MIEICYKFMCFIISFFIISIFVYDIMKENIDKRNIIENMSDSDVQRMVNVEGEINQLATAQEGIINDIIVVKQNITKQKDKYNRQSTKIAEAIRIVEDQSQEKVSGEEDPCKK